MPLFPTNEVQIQ